MVTPIKYFRTDPNKLGRGPGVYYHRGKGYYSMYDLKRDYNKLSDGWKTNRVGVPKATRFPHISDGNLLRKKW